MKDARVNNQKTRFLPFYYTLTHCSLLAIPLLCLFALYGLVFLGCEEKVKPPVGSIGIPPDRPTQESWNTEIQLTASGRLVAKIHAGYIAVYADRKYTILDSNIVVDFYDENQNHTSVLTAERGKVDDVHYNLEAYGNVVVVSDSGSTLKTDRLYWDNSTQKVHTDAYVEISSPNEFIQGHGFESDQNLSYYKIFKVTGKSRLEKEK